MILDTLAASTRRRVEAAKENIPLSTMMDLASQASESEREVPLTCVQRNVSKESVFSFEKALKAPGMSFICEVKKASPSKGLIASDFPYVDIAKDYEAAGLKKLLSPDITAVGVFVNSPIDDIVRLVSRGIIGAVQLHGDMEGFETVQYAEDLKKALAAARLAASVPLIRAVRVKDGDDIRRAVSYPAEYLLFDTFVKDQYGGSGVRFDWSLIPHIEKPWFLAGGISASTIKEALNTEACCLDISSAVETDGRKDPKKIQEIIQTVRSV